MATCKRLLITPGEPAGIGPDIVLQIAQLDFDDELIVIANTDLMIERSKQLNLPITLLPVDLEQAATPHQARTLKIIHVDMPVTSTPGQLDIRLAPYVIQTLELAAKLCLTKKAHGIITGPVHKACINDAGIAFSGHTEFFAHYTNTPLTVMLFVVNELRVALATTHLALQDVPKAITKERLQSVLAILIEGLKTLFALPKPTILVSGLNPHAGENGHLGREEIDIITPALTSMHTDAKLIGPLPADTLFTRDVLKTGDAVLAMYHDQALPLVKYLGFHDAVNVTLGLPFIRTSVDHGTALDLAGTGRAHSGSLKAAIDLCALLPLQH